MRILCELFQCVLAIPVLHTCLYCRKRFFQAHTDLNFIKHKFLYLHRATPDCQKTVDCIIYILSRVMGFLLNFILFGLHSMVKYNNFLQSPPSYLKKGKIPRCDCYLEHLSTSSFPYSSRDYLVCPVINKAVLSFPIDIKMFPFHAYLYKAKGVN